MKGSNMYVFISCSKSKLDKPCTAQEMYSPSDIFTKRFAYAKKVTSRDKIFILSAKYGLLRLDDIIEPYDLFLNDQSTEYKSKWAEKVIKQMKEQGIDFNEKSYFATNSCYSELLSKAFPNSFTETDAVYNQFHKRSLGYRKGFYNHPFSQIRAITSESNTPYRYTQKATNRNIEQI